MELWFTEKVEDKVGLTLKIKNTLHSENIPYQHTYPNDLWSFAFCSKQYDPLRNFNSMKLELKTQYYNQEIHRSAFSLPNFIKEWVR